MCRPGSEVRPAGPSLAEVLRLGLEGAQPKLSPHQWKVLRALLACRAGADLDGGGWGWFFISGVVAPARVSAGVPPPCERSEPI